MCEYEVTTPEERADVANIRHNPNDSEGFFNPVDQDGELKCR